MPNHMEPRRRSEPVNVGRVRPATRGSSYYEDDRLSWMDRRQDRAAESHHVVRMNDYERQAEEGAAGVARDGVIAVAEIEADSKAVIAEIQAERKVLTEMKNELRRAHEESQLMAGEDIELQTWFAQMDAAWYRDLRLRFLR